MQSLHEFPEKSRPMVTTSFERKRNYYDVALVQQNGTISKSWYLKGNNKNSAALER